MSKTAKLKIFRYDPGEGSPRYQSYDVALSESLTVIQALFHLASVSDDPPAFRRFMCNRGQCASCVMTIDGRTRRACTTKVKDGMVLEPLYDYPVIRDLVVDFGTRVEREGEGYYTVRTGSLVLRSSGRRPGSLTGPWVFMDVDTRRCESCAEKPCVRACWVNRIENLEDANGVRIPPYSAPIRLDNGRAVLSGVCSMCESWPCIEKCPAQAFQFLAQGAATRINPKKCIGCGLCVAACSKGCIWMNLERGHAVKCDLCGGDPECVKACPYGAIQFEVIKKRTAVRTDRHEREED